MELLDLRSHEPEEYEGKLVICNGCEYVIGSHLGAGAERTVHKLINRRSELCLHAIKIWHDQVLSGIFIEEHEKAIALLRRDLELRRIILISLYFHGHGGVFELQNFAGGYEEETDAISNYIQEADHLMNSANYAEAISLYQHAISIKPFHTVALHNLAVSQAELHNYYEAYRTEKKVIGIEPNYILYRGAHISFAAQNGHLRQSINLFEDMKSLFPYVHDYDSLGVRIYLECGNPQEAENLLAEGMLSDSEIKELKEPTKAALSAKARSLPMIKQAKDLILSDKSDDPNARSLLEKAYEVYDKDAFLAINLGLALRRAGDFNGSLRLLLYAASIVPEIFVLFCYANAAFSLINASKYDQAMPLLEATMNMLSILYRGCEPTDLTELPGVAIWIDERVVIEKRIQTAAALIEQAIVRCPKKEKVTEGVRRLTALYKKAAET